MGLAKIKSDVHKQLAKLITRSDLPSHTKEELTRIRKSLDKSNTYEELERRMDEIHELSDGELRLTRQQRSNIYSPVCWIEDYLKEAGYLPKK